MKSLKVAMFSFADIDNYGDILFSHIVKMEMESRVENLTIDFYTPSSLELQGFKYEAYFKEKVDGKYDLMILAGGEVVHLFDERTWHPIYTKKGQKIISKNPSDVVWDWVNCSSGFKAWMSVGVRTFGDKWDREKISETINALDYVSVRGIISKKILEESDYDSFNAKITLTPDLGWLFPKYLTYSENYGKHYRKWVSEGEKYLIFQVHNINEEEAKKIGESLLEFQLKNNITVLMMPVIHLWNDEIYLDMVSKSVGNQLKILPNNLSVFEMADLIVHSEIVACSSLHVAITALAAGLPAAIFNKWQGTKLQDLYGLQFRTQYLFNDFNNVGFVLEKLLSEKNSSKSLAIYAEFMKTKLDETFDELIDLINKR